MTRAARVEALGDWLHENVPAGSEITSDDLEGFWATSGVPDHSRGTVMASACHRHWLRATGRVAVSSRASRRGALIMIYEATGRA